MQRRLEPHHRPFLAEHFVNRELSWLEFNGRVLEEAQDTTTPLLERLKFLSIFSSNLDEFFMVRVAGLREQAFAEEAPQDFNPDGLTSIQQLERIAIRVRELLADQYACLQDDVLPGLEKHGIRLVAHSRVAHDKFLNTFFRGTVFPIITPMAVDPSHPRPRYHNRGLYVAAKLRRRRGLGPKRLFAVVQVPQVLPRLVRLPNRKGHQSLLLEDLIAARLPEFFEGFEVKTSASFRITRDGDLSLLEEEGDDMLRMIEERLKARRRADAVRLEIAAGADEELVQMIVRQEQLHDGSIAEHPGYSEVYRIPGPLDVTGFFPLVRLLGFDRLRDKPYTPQIPRRLGRPNENIFTAIRRRDVLLHHPFESFAPVVDFVSRAASDGHVLAIKQTLYRTSGDSPIVAALARAAEAGKQVTAIVELTARFDEEANVGWARQLERAGVHVVFGFMGLKTHCKIAMVVRQESDAVRRYVHMSTGNYNPITAQIYTDLGMFTCDDAFADDVSALFNLLTGYSQGHKWQKLIVAPMDLHDRVIELIDEQAELAKSGKPSRIFVKMNSLVDHHVVQALYRASQAGVPIDLVIRDICCLRPGIEGISDNIRVRSIVDRFLEHTRIQVFGAGPDSKIYLSSADWMPRNFFRRVEAMFPVEAPALRKRMLEDIIPLYLQDNVRARQLTASGGPYMRPQPADTEPRCRAQFELLKRYVEDEDTVE
jgi:polyphosphate kinase